MELQGNSKGTKATPTCGRDGQYAVPLHEGDQLGQGSQARKSVFAQFNNKIQLWLCAILVKGLILVSGFWHKLLGGKMHTQRKEVFPHL